MNQTYQKGKNTKFNKFEELTSYNHSNYNTITSISELEINYKYKNYTKMKRKYGMNKMHY